MSLMFNHQLMSLGIALTWGLSRLPWTLTSFHCSTWILNQWNLKGLERWLHTIKLLVRIFCSFFDNFYKLHCLCTCLFLGHYKWALDELFYKHNLSRVIILEGETLLLYFFFLSLLIIFLWVYGRSVYW